MIERNDEHFNFPCDFPIKVMGRTDCELESLVVEIINKHVDDLAEGAVKSRPSGKGNFLSVTVTVTAHSREQLDNIYLELTAREEVLMAL
jgi:putative lipoic acid-binding regulatory protein